VQKFPCEQSQRRGEGRSQLLVQQSYRHLPQPEHATGRHFKHGFQKITLRPWILLNFKRFTGFWGCFIGFQGFFCIKPSFFSEKRPTQWALKFAFKSLKEYISFHRKLISELRSVICRIGSHSVTCHPTR